MLAVQRVRAAYRDEVLEVLDIDDSYRMRGKPQTAAADIPRRSRRGLSTRPRVCRESVRTLRPHQDIGVKNLNLALCDATSLANGCHIEENNRVSMTREPCSPLLNHRNIDG